MLRGRGATSAILFLLPIMGVANACGERSTIVVVGAKNFTESRILQEIVAQQLERAGIRDVQRKDCGGTLGCHDSLTAGAIDVYVEYSGSAYSLILDLGVERQLDRQLAAVDSVYRDRWDLRWAEPLGFDNAFAMVIRAEDASRLGITTISEAVPHARRWRAAFGYEFEARRDGYGALRERYGMTFRGAPTVMNLDMTYRALRDRRADIIAGNATDGQIEAYDLVELTDDLGFRQPYRAAPVMRSEAWNRMRVRRAVRALGGTVSASTMKHLNCRVTVDGVAIHLAASAFLDSMHNRAAPPGASTASRC